MEAAGNGMSYKVWPGQSKDVAVALKGFVFVFVDRRAAQLEFVRMTALASPEGEIRPQLFMVRAFGRQAAMSKVLDQLYLKRVNGAERVG